MLIAEQNETKHRAQNMKVSLYCVTASEKNRLNKSLAPLKHIVKEWTFSVDGRMWKCYELYNWCAIWSMRLGICVVPPLIRTTQTQPKLFMSINKCGVIHKSLHTANGFYWVVDFAVCMFYGGVSTCTYFVVFLLCFFLIIIVATNNSGIPFSWAAHANIYFRSSNNIHIKINKQSEPS